MKKEDALRYERIIMKQILKTPYNYSQQRKSLSKVIIFKTVWYTQWTTRHLQLVPIEEINL